MVRDCVIVDPTWYAWRFKLDHTLENDARVEEWCYLQGSRWIISREHGDSSGNPHYQGALMAECSKFKLHQSIKEDLSLFDRDFSCKPCRKPEVYFSYLTKEEVLIWFTDFPRDSIPGWVAKSEFKKTKAPSKESFMDRMILDFEASQDEETEGDILPISIYNWVCAYFIKHTKIHDRYIIDRHANVLVGKYADEYRRAQVHRWGSEWASYSGWKRSFDSIHDPNAIQSSL